MSKLLDVLAECCREIKQKSMKKKLIFEVEEGNTWCIQCPFYIAGNCENKKIDCEKNDLSTLKFIGEEDYDNEH